MKDLAAFLDQHRYSNHPQSQKILALVNEILGVQKNNVNAHQLQTQIHINNKNHQSTIISLLHQWKDLQNPNSLSQLAQVVLSAEQSLIPESTLLRLFQDYIKELELKTNYQPSKEKLGIPKVIWIVWLSKLNWAPKIVQLNIKQLAQCFPNHNVRVVSEENLSEWIKLPTEVLKKYRNHQASRHHISQLIYLELLYQHGGIAVDPFIYFYTPLKEVETHSDIYLLKPFSSDDFYTKVMSATMSSSSIKLMKDIFTLYLTENPKLFQKNILNIIIKAIVLFSKNKSETLKQIPKLNLESSLQLSQHLESENPITIREILSSFPFHILAPDTPTKGLSND